MICWLITPHMYSVFYTHTHHKVQIMRGVLCLFCDSPLQTRSAGFGTHLPLDDTQVALIIPAGTKRSLHLKNIWAPPTVLMLWMLSMEPFTGSWGIPQLTRWGRHDMNILRKKKQTTSPCPNKAQLLLCKVLHKVKWVSWFNCKIKHRKGHTQWFLI